jgi:hypothetical protein
MRYLLAAEADKIQDFIFRSSRLREVVGASQLLTRFCKEVGEQLATKDEYKGKICVNDGGSFRVIFDDSERARRFGADLAELYRLSLGTSISVAEPVPLSDDFMAANKLASAALRQAKNHRRGVVAEPHLPYMAFCASCGIGLANKHGLLVKEQGDRDRYLCPSCQTKAEERQNRTVLLDEFLKLAIGSNEHVTDFTWPEDADAVARYDLRQRNYVAYLVADGNGMGKLFGKCGEEQISQLSTNLTKELRASLAEPTKLLLGDLQFQYDDKGKRIVPVLPLILGGDDLFALIPAPYALDFAYRFCQEWERRLATLLTSPEIDLEIGEGPDKIPKPTIAAAVVICKSKYPYALAHKRAETLLKEAKRQSKLVAAETGQHFSAVNFEVILGNRLAGQDEDEALPKYRVLPSLRPYWVVPEGSQLPPDRGLDLKTLIDQRFQLKDVPNKRLNELRRRFAELPAGKDYAGQQAAFTAWTRALETLIERSSEQAQSIRAALQALGDEPKPAEGRNHYWRRVKRHPEPGDAHGLLDLLESWDFAQDLEKAPDAYEAEEDEA